MCLCRCMCVDIYVCVCVYTFNQHYYTSRRLKYVKGDCFIINIIMCSYCILERECVFLKTLSVWVGVNSTTNTAMWSALLSVEEIPANSSTKCLEYLPAGAPAHNSGPSWTIKIDLREKKRWMLSVTVNFLCSFLSVLCHWFYITHGVIV